MTEQEDAGDVLANVAYKMSNEKVATALVGLIEAALDPYQGDETKMPPLLAIRTHEAIGEIAMGALLEGNMAKLGLAEMDERMDMLVSALSSFSLAYILAERFEIPFKSAASFEALEDLVSKMHSPKSFQETMAKVRERVESMFARTQNTPEGGDPPNRGSEQMPHEGAGGDV